MDECICSKNEWMNEWMKTLTENFHGANINRAGTYRDIGEASTPPIPCKPRQTVSHRYPRHTGGGVPEVKLEDARGFAESLLVELILRKLRGVSGRDDAHKTGAPTADIRCACECEHRAVLSNPKEAQVRRSTCRLRDNQQAMVGSYKS